MQSENLPVTGNTKSTKPENRAFYPALDGLRAVAFLMVFFQHYAAIPWGWTGVNIFFVLSGFLITGILYDSRNDAFRARNFYIRRALRIFPLYYSVFLGILLLYPIGHWRWSSYWLAWPFYIANFLPYLSNSILVNGSRLQFAAWALLTPAAFPRLVFFLGHFWSLCVEEQFYFVWPWVVFWVRSRRALMWICGVVVIFAPLVRVLCNHIAPPWMLQAELLYRVTPFQLDSLLLGAFVALAIRGQSKVRIGGIAKISASAAGLIAFAVLVTGIATSYPNWRGGYHYPASRFTWGLTLINVFAASIIVIALEPSNWIHRMLRVKPLRWLGRISYGAYIFHDMFRSIYFGIVSLIGRRTTFVAHHITLFVSLVGLCSTLLIAWLSFEYLESVFLNLKERWTIRQAVDALQTVQGGE